MATLADAEAAAKVLDGLLSRGLLSQEAAFTLYPAINHVINTHLRAEAADAELAGFIIEMQSQWQWKLPLD